MRNVPVKNRDPEFNCHGWVDLAVMDLYEAHYLTYEQYDAGVDAMMAATLEAQDENIA